MSKADYFRRLGEMRAPGESEASKDRRAARLVDAWAAEGLKLASPIGRPAAGSGRGAGKLGNSFDAQRLILLGLGGMLQPGFKPDLFTYLNIYGGNRWGLGASCFHEIVQEARGTCRNVYGF